VWGLALLGLISLAVLYTFDPTQHGFYPACYWKRWTGFNCAGCGCLRSTHHLLHGDIAVAFRHNPLWVAFLPIASLWVLWMGWRSLRAAPPQPPIIRPRFPWLGWGAGILVLYTILRNIPALSPWLSPP
jgi:hypothetical protein